MEELSLRQKQILDFISDFLEDKGYAPSVRDVVRGYGISSASVAQYHLNVLERKGYIRRDRDVPRSIGLARKATTFVAVPVLGTIAAGQPIPVPSADTWIATPEETLEVPQYLTGGLEGLYALRVKGASMIDALVDDQDIVLMQQASTVEDGEMAAVWLRDEQEATLKKVYRERERIRLQPANRSIEPIYTRPDNVQIQGKVVGVMRKV